MKLFVFILLITFLSVQLMQNIRKVPKFYNEEAIDENELGDFQKLLNRFNLLSSNTSENLKRFKDERNRIVPNMRFTQSEKKDEDDSSDVKFSDDNSSTGGAKDQELKRIEGLSNGLILYNSKRTVNVETSDYSHLYFDIEN